MSTGVDALRALRRTRQRRRLGDFEWFDAAYRVYLVALTGGGGVIWLSSVLGTKPVSALAAARAAEHGPRLVGVIAALAVLIGLRGGAQGGPLALEAGDVPMLLLASLDRRAALTRPMVQRVRSALGMGAALGAVAGLLAGQRLPGSPWAWGAGGALCGATIAALWAGSALVAHGAGLPRAAATALGLALVGVQGAALAWRFPGPADRVGSLGLWGWRQHPVDLIAVAVAVAALVAGWRLVGRTSLEALARRSSLVAQLRFAVTMQDLRTVILLRRQLNQEHARSRPWMRVPRWAGRGAVLRRGLAGLVRFPLTRVVRMVAIAAAAGVLLGWAARGATAAVLAAAFCWFLLGLETMEPLAQEIDQGNWTDSFPIARGEILVRHLVAPVVLLVPLAAIAGAGALAVVGVGHWVPVAVLALPTTLAGVCGGVVSIVRDAPDPFSAQRQQAFVPPEMAGMGTALRVLIPFVVSLLPCLAALALHRGGPAVSMGTVARLAAADLLLAGLVVIWVRHRDRVRARFRQFMEEGKNYQPKRPLPGVDE